MSPEDLARRDFILVRKGGAECPYGVGTEARDRYFNEIARLRKESIHLDVTPIKHGQMME